MQLTTIFSAFSLASVVLAAPLQTCLSYEQASCIVDQFIGFLDGTGYNNQNQTDTAKALISDDFTADSGSSRSLQELPLDGLYATSKAQFISDVVEDGPYPNIRTNDIIIGCNKIVWYWTAPQVGTGEYEVKGFNLFEINSQYQICKTYLEFNSIAWGLDTNQGPLCPTNSTD
ncbi:hypothetical protein KC343_g3467 [Hortaea werneckii]|uniref:NTF2-like domain-containing protein n=1 Tax=Hortaea werneckii TaxID=91943 RepID=A0A3M7DZJ7_HORWE|nr:hypothetical protein KC352_g13581 [Hortaea werneckii]KAI7564950.1 hypothetical protein KC317_g6702 [Hortaea werneckii]KAI7615645.1 hypothetical protein KC346_g6374 [Hortaea werneckii]KAI7632465.1 hypothetical protein KC343_g3467 [Hortaea werneckii]KAI7673397.1 hypothetical protein KC319_g5066 [Hortaea werneckii]